MTGSGRFLDVDQQDQEILVRGLVTSQYVARVSRQVGAGATSFGIAESWNLWPKALEMAEELVKEDSATGLLSNESAEDHWSWMHENRQLWSEHVVTSPVEGQGIGVANFLRHLHRMELSAFGIKAFIGGPIVELFQTRSKEANWMRRIKNTIDPNWNADASFYVAPKPLPAAGMLPFFKRILFSRPLIPVVRFIFQAATRKTQKHSVVKRPD